MKFLHRVGRLRPTRRSARGIAAGVFAAVLGAVLAFVLIGVPGDDSSDRPEAQFTPPDRTSSAGADGPGESDDLLVVPDIGLAAPMIDIEVDPDGVLSPPSDVSEVGFWQRSAVPGALEGQTVITGHTVHTGGGVMNELGELDKGDDVRVRFDGEFTSYEVTKVETLTRAEVAEQAYDLFGQDREEGRLVLVTCTEWDGSVYQSNIIVFAEPLRAA